MTQSRAGWWAVLLGTWIVLVDLTALQVWLSTIALGAPTAMTPFVLSRVIDAAFVLPVFAAIDQLARRASPQRVGWPRFVVTALVLLALAAIASAQWSDRLAAVVSGHGIRFVGSRPAKAIAELVTLALAVGAATAYELHGRLRAHESQALQLEARLAEARLQALSAQLHPHFLFNTLNAIAVLVHRDPDAADATLTRLADLLRATLRQPPSHEIPLRDELALLDRYVEIMRVRHGARLTVDVCADATLDDVLVPSFVLQPLVENAIEHGIARRAGPGTVTVAVSLASPAVASRLRLEVTDDGPGIGASYDDGGERGIGLPNTRRRLEQLYGDEAHLVLEEVVGVGTRARIELPVRRAATTRRDA